jgi:hypothetical protein
MIAGTEASAAAIRRLVKLLDIKACKMQLVVASSAQLENN